MKIYDSKDFIPQLFVSKVIFLTKHFLFTENIFKFPDKLPKNRYFLFLEIKED